MKTYEMKAEPLTTSQLERWLSGKIPRRHLALPFGGPVKDEMNAKGVDADFEFFDGEPCRSKACLGPTDFYGDFPQLRASRERLADWHHVTFGDRTDPTGVMKGVILGKIVMDEEPSSEDVDGIEYSGIWSDFWINAGERKRALLATLERRHQPIYGSSQPVQKAVLTNPETGHIEVWPVRFHTLTTSPQNTHAVMAPMKALLDDPYMADLSVGALRAYLTGADDLGSDLLSIAVGDGAPGKGDAKAEQVAADQERAIHAAVDRLIESLDRHNAALSENR